RPDRTNTGSARLAGYARGAPHLQQNATALTFSVYRVQSPEARNPGAAGAQQSRAAPHLRHGVQAHPIQRRLAHMAQARASDPNSQSLDGQAALTPSFTKEEIDAVRLGVNGVKGVLPARCYYDEECHRFEVVHIL